MVVDQEGVVETPAPAHRGGWWRRDHPVFIPLTGFFTGTVLVSIIVVALGAVLRLIGLDLTENPQYFAIAIAALLVIDAGLMVWERSRRFARYMLFGLLITPVVAGATAALTLYLLINND
ncbi:hypothetical protein [Nocardioides sp.]|uniref:hypothetical protein n=1 Tax=Nocardioides sp. TaxID=35761 RepID=UPI003511FCEF